MKIAFVYDAVYPWSIGGVERRIYELAKRLAVEHEVHLFGIKWWKGAHTIRKDKINIHGVCKPKRLYVNGKRSISEAIYFAINILIPLLKKTLILLIVRSFHTFLVLLQKYVLRLLIQENLS